MARTACLFLVKKQGPDAIDDVANWVYQQVATLDSINRFNPVESKLFFLH